MRGKWLGGTMFGTMDVCLCGCNLGVLVVVG